MPLKTVLNLSQKLFLIVLDQLTDSNEHLLGNLQLIESNYLKGVAIWLFRRVKTENIRNVTMLDPISKNEVTVHLSTLDVALINLKKSDLFTTVIPSKIFETSAMEIPILLGVDGEARSIIEQYGAGLFYAPENKEDFIRKVDQLFSDPFQIEHCEAGCRKLVRDFDRKILAGKMLSVIGNSLT